MKRVFIAGLVVVVLVAAGAVAALTLGGGDGLDDVRAEPAVERASIRLSGDVTLELRPSADRAGVLAALAELPEEAGRVSVRLGRSVLELREREVRDAGGLVSTLLALAAVRSPFESFEISRTAGVDASVAQPEQAAPLAIEVVEALVVDGEPPAVRDLRIDVGGKDVSDVSSISVGLDAAGSDGAALAVLRASIELADRQPRVGAGDRSIELRLRAESVADAADAWQEATQALERSGAPSRRVKIYLARAPEDGGRPLPLLSGFVDEQPGPAMGLLRTLDARGTRAYVTTDRSYAQLRADDAGAARVAATAAREVGIKRFEASWLTTEDDPAWLGGTAGTDRTATVIDDAPAVVLQLLPGIAKARRAGLDAVHWDRQAVDGQPRFRFTRPSWFPLSDNLKDKPESMRRLADAVRALEWPGIAKFDVIVGEGNCAGASGSAVVEVTSTSRGRAHAVESESSCASSDELAAVRRGWNGTVIG